MIARFDSFNRFEHPKFTLCSPTAQYNGGNITGTIGGIAFKSDEELVVNFNETSNLNFVVYKVDNELDPSNIYNRIAEKQNVFVDGIGFFSISDVSEHITEESVYKDISAQSCEIEIQNKTIPASFYSQESNLDYAYNTTFQFSTLIELLVRALPLWSLAHVDESVSLKYRTFEDISEDTNILSFMLSDMQDAYECIFVFDIINRYIYVYDQNNYVHTTDIHISNRDIVDSLTISSSADDIYTSINVIGGDNLNIAGVNPTGTNTLYKYDYFFNVMSDGLAEKVSDWQNLINQYANEYYEYNSLYYSKLGDRSNIQSELSRIATQISLYERCKNNIVAASGMTESNLVCYTASGDSSVQIEGIVQQYNSSGTDIDSATVFGEELIIQSNQATTTYVASGTSGQQIVGLYIKDNNGIYIQKLEQASSVSADHFTYNSSTKKLTFNSGQFPDNTKIGVFYHPSDSSVPEDTVIVTDLLAAIEDELTILRSSQIDYSEELDAINVQIESVKSNIDNIHGILDMNTYFTNEELTELSLYTFEGEYKDDYIIVTDSMTYSQQLEQIKILYDRAVLQLEKISIPTQEFSLDVENFIFQKRFSDWTEQLETGCLINVEIYPGELAALFLSNFTVNYEDESLSMTFGNRYNKFNPKALFDNVLGGISRTANSISFIKDTIYPITSGEFNAIKRALESIRTLSAGQALTSEGQDIIIDSTGFTGKKRSGENEFYPEQLKIINNMIALTDDSWETCKVAIGKLLLADGTYKYGVNAEVLMGDMILGNELHILAQDSGGNYSDIFSVMQERIEAHVPEIHAITTNVGYTFNDKGLSIQRADKEMVNLLNEDGMQVSLIKNSEPEQFEEDLQLANNKIVLSYPAIDVSNNFDISVSIGGSSISPSDLLYDNQTHTVSITSGTYPDGTNATVTYYRGSVVPILTARNTGVITKNMVAEEFLTVGLHARFENYSNDTDSNRTGCFYI